MLLRAMASLPGVQLNVIGGAHQEPVYHQFSDTLNLNNVNFLGEVSDQDLQTMLKHSHVLVLPSRSKSEAFGILLLEAMAAGCVPISSNLPGVRDVVGQVGFTFPVADFHALSHLLSYLRDHPDVVERYARQAQAKAQRYTWQRTLDAHERLFRQLIVNEEIKAAVKAGKAHEVAILETLSAHLETNSSALYQGNHYQLERYLIYGENLAWPDEAVYQHGVLGFVVEQQQTMRLPDDVQETYLVDRLDVLANRSTLVTMIHTPEPYLFCFSRSANQQPFTAEDRRWLENIATRLASTTEGETQPLPTSSTPRKAKSSKCRLKSGSD